MTQALVMIDVQRALIADRDEGYPWANPQAPARFADLPAMTLANLSGDFARVAGVVAAVAV